MLLDGSVAMGRRIYLPSYEALKEEVLKEAYESHFASPPRSTRMYMDLKRVLLVA
jgi:hypothetical protein